MDPNTYILVNIICFDYIKNKKGNKNERQRDK